MKQLLLKMGKDAEMRWRSRRLIRDRHIKFARPDDRVQRNSGFRDIYGTIIFADVIAHSRRNVELSQMS